MNNIKMTKAERHIATAQVGGGDFYFQAREQNENNYFIFERAMETSTAFNRFAH